VPCVLGGRSGNVVTRQRHVIRPGSMICPCHGPDQANVVGGRSNQPMAAIPIRADPTSRDASSTS